MESDGFEGRDTTPFDDDGSFDAPVEGTGTRETFKPPIKPGEGTVVPQKKTPKPPTLDDVTAQVERAKDGGFQWTVAPVRSRVRVRSSFGNPVVARTSVDPNADWETVPVTKVAEK